MANKITSKKLGIDIGFGDVKVVPVDGDSFKFSTSIAPYVAGVDLGNDARIKTYKYNGEEFIVGDETASGNLGTRSKGFLQNYSALLIAKAIDLYGSDVDEISIGLALNHYASNNGQFRKELKRSLSAFYVNEKHYELTVHVYPQAVGILADFRIDENGEVRDETEIDGLVLDIGFNTVDVVTFKNGQAVSHDSGCFEGGGICNIITPLAQLVSTNHDLDIQEQEAKKIFLEREICFFGKSKDYGLEIDRLTKRYVKELFVKIDGKWSGSVARAGKVIIAGGGSYYIKDLLPENLTEICFIPELAEFSNARGFLKVIQ